MSVLFQRLWTKVRETLEQHRGPLAVSNTISRLSILSFIPKIFVVKFAVNCTTARWI